MEQGQGLMDGETLAVGTFPLSEGLTPSFLLRRGCSWPAGGLPHMGKDTAGRTSIWGQRRTR